MNAVLQVMVTIAATGVVTVVVVEGAYGVARLFGPHRGSRGVRGGRHAEAAAVALPPGDEAPAPDFYGSMSLADERKIRFVPGEASHVHEREDEPMRSPGGILPELVEIPEPGAGPAPEMPVRLDTGGKGAGAADSVSSEVTAAPVSAGLRTIEGICLAEETRQAVERIEAEAREYLCAVAVDCALWMAGLRARLAAAA